LSLPSAAHLIVIQLVFKTEEYFMWLLRKQRSQRDILKKAFSRYVGEQKVGEIVHDQEDLELTIKHVNFLLVMVRQDPRQAKTIRQVVRIVQEEQAMIQSITNTLITVYCGVPIHEPSAGKMREDLVIKLTESLGSDLAIVHGECDCPVGIVGTEDRANYTALLPEYQTKLAGLLSLDFGQVKEVSCV
jgi:hypothetical protein